jgi:predicted heme/steroid binding protein
MREDLMSETKDQRGNIGKINSAEIEEFDGVDGRPLYVVFKGKVYDLSTSKLWLQGKHMGIHTRSQNLSEAIKSAPHGDENIHRFPVIGDFHDPPSMAQAAIPEEKASLQKPSPSQQQSMNRRGFLKLAAAAGGAITIAAVASSLKAATFVPELTAPSEWPRVKVANINQIELL